MFAEDQIHVLKYGNHRGKEWSDETIQKSLKLYMACGTKGYEELCRQNFPLPAIRTLQHRISSLKFEPGVLEDIFELLKLKVNGCCYFNLTNFLHYFNVRLKILTYFTKHFFYFRWRHLTRMNDMLLYC
jgi:hypothetical protein